MSLRNNLVEAKQLLDQTLNDSTIIRTTESIDVKNSIDSIFSNQNITLKNKLIQIYNLLNSVVFEKSLVEFRLASGLISGSLLKSDHWAAAGVPADGAPRWPFFLACPCLVIRIKWGSR